MRCIIHSVDVGQCDLDALDVKILHIDFKNRTNEQKPVQREQSSEQAKSAARISLQSNSSQIS